MPGLNHRGAIITRLLDDGRTLDVWPLTFGRARLTISDNMTDVTWRDGW